MSRRVIAPTVCALALLAASGVAAAAQDVTTLPERPVAEPPAPVPSFRLSLGSSLPLVDLADLEQLARPIEPPPPVELQPRASGQKTLMASLYVSTAAMQALDVHSTLQALDKGAVEANPLMSGLTKSPAAFVAVKALVATGTIMATRKLAKRNKVAAVITLVAINTAYAFVAHHNYKVARSIK